MLGNGLKQILRRQISREERQMTQAERSASDAVLTSQLIHFMSFLHVTTVMLFSPFGTEPDLKPVFDTCLAAGKHIVLPRMTQGSMLECREYLDGKGMILGSYGILEPGNDCPLVERDKIDFILVPAVCYDEQGGRLGRGAGYYDRFLTGYTGLTVGLCRSRFLQKTLPLEPHDIRVKTVVTEERVIQCE